MARYVATTIISTPLPMWDSFEAIFFVVAGVSVGIVFGVLFPSVWRSFRRGFRKKSHYAPLVEKWDDRINVKIKILSNEGEESVVPADSTSFYVHIFEAFTAARYYFQTGNTRKAVSLYIEILTYEKVSKQDTNRALFELSQVYAFIGLSERAFDTALELLNRMPTYNAVLAHLLKICTEHFSPDKVNVALNAYKGIPDATLKRSIAHSMCRIAEGHLKKQDITQAIDFSRLAVKWDRSSARALTLLWETTSRQFWQKNSHDKKITWLSFATDLEARAQICESSKVSAAAGGKYLSHLLEELLNLPHSLEYFQQVHKEFISIFSWEKFALPVQKKLQESLFYAILILHKKRCALSPVPGRLQIKDLYPSETAQILALVTNQTQGRMLSFLDYHKCQEAYLFLGAFVHQCTQCQSFFPEFFWHCSHCGLEECLVPANNFQAEVVT